MSKLSRFLIGVIIAGLAFITSINLYRAYEKHVQETESDSFATQTFHQVPVSYAPVEPDIPVYKKYEEPGQKEIYLEDPTLDPEQAQQQARETVKSILEDYRQDPSLQAFYQDLQESTGKNINLEDLSGENLGAILQQYPQVQEVIRQHSQDPQFAKTLQEIFTNPQFVQSVAVLQSGQNQPSK